jgi:hypothetical protein
MTPSVTDISEDTEASDVIRRNIIKGNISHAITLYKNITRLAEIKSIAGASTRNPIPIGVNYLIIADDNVLTFSERHRHLESINCFIIGNH